MKFSTIFILFFILAAMVVSADNALTAQISTKGIVSMTQGASISNIGIEDPTIAGMEYLQYRETQEKTANYLNKERPPKQHVKR